MTFLPSRVLQKSLLGSGSLTCSTRPIVPLRSFIHPVSLLSSPQENSQAQLAWPHMGDTFLGWLHYTHARPRLSLSLISLLLPLDIRLPPRFPLFHPVGAFLKNAAALNDGEFRLGEADCRAGFAVGVFGLFEGLWSVVEWHGEEEMDRDKNRAME